MRVVKKPWIRTAGAVGALMLAGSLTLSGCNLTGSDDGDTNQQQDDSGDDNQNDSGDDNQDDGDDSGDTNDDNNDDQDG